MSEYKTKQEVIEALESFYANPGISKEKMKTLLGDISDHLVSLGERLENENPARDGDDGETDKKDPEKEAKTPAKKAAAK